MCLLNHHPWTPCESTHFVMVLHVPPLTQKRICKCTKKHEEHDSFPSVCHEIQYHLISFLLSCFQIAGGYRCSQDVRLRNLRCPLGSGRDAWNDIIMVHTKMWARGIVLWFDLALCSSLWVRKPFACAVQATGNFATAGYHTQRPHSISATEDIRSSSTACLRCPASMMSLTNEINASCQKCPDEAEVCLPDRLKMLPGRHFIDGFISGKTGCLVLLTKIVKINSNRDMHIIISSHIQGISLPTLGL